MHALDSRQAPYSSVSSRAISKWPMPVAFKITHGIAEEWHEPISARIGNGEAISTRCHSLGWYHQVRPRQGSPVYCTLDTKWLQTGSNAVLWRRANLDVVNGQGKCINNVLQLRLVDSLALQHARCSRN